MTDFTTFEKYPMGIATVPAFNLPVVKVHKVRQSDFIVIKQYKGEIPSIKRKINGVKTVVYRGPLYVKVLKVDRFYGLTNKGKKTGTGNLCLCKDIPSGEIRSLYIEDANWKFMGLFRSAWYTLREQWAN